MVVDDSDMERALSTACLISYRQGFPVAQKQLNTINYQHRSQMSHAPNVNQPSYKRHTAPAQQAASRQSRPMPPQGQQPLPQLRQPRKKNNLAKWLLIVPIVGVMLILLAVLIGIMSLRLVYADQILPQVESARISLGGMTEAEAAQALQANWGTIILRNQDGEWRVDAEDFGLTLNAAKTAERAFAQGHGEGGMTALFRTVNIPPVVQVSEAKLAVRLQDIANEQINTAATNAGVAFQNGQVVATPAEAGLAVDIQGTLQALYASPFALADSTIPLVMQRVEPQITDATPLVQEAQRLLSNPLQIAMYDPITDERLNVTIPTNIWGTWLTATSDPTSPIGLALQANPTLMEETLTQRVSNQLGAERAIDIDEAVAVLQAGLEAGQPETVQLIVSYNERSHVVRAGETITSIAWDYGVPYPFVQQLNGGIESISVGQTIRIPAADAFIELPVVPNKRIVVDISEQRTRVYENGQLKWDWVSSTGIDSSPTWTGMYQILSHEQNAYAGNWNLYMPNFMGVYRPVPGSDFTNGFHGFPTRGGGQLLWENSLGRRVTYGCILLSDTNVRQLYQWAEEGVIVEIRA
jgi:lipoprotein-anchoring transpeptidase ErfK/SrfK